MKNILLVLTLLLFYFTSYSQVAINTDGSQPDGSAILDVKSTSKGMLIPRMTTAQRNAISSPAQGLMVYDTDDSTFYYFKKNSWFKIGYYYSQWQENGNYIYTYDSVGIGTTSPDVPLEVNGAISQTGLGNSVFLGEGAGFKNTMSSKNYNTAVGYMALYNNISGKYNVAVGDSALFSNQNGNYNIALGASALTSNINADYNTAIGWKSMNNNTSGYGNTAIGTLSLTSNVSGYSNTAAGDSALYSNISYANTALGASSLQKNYSGFHNVAGGYEALWKNMSSYNTAFGYQSLINTDYGSENSAFGKRSLYANTSGNNNVAAGSLSLTSLTYGNNNTIIGYSAGFSLSNGSGNVFIGSEAGYNDIDCSNKLIISNNSTDDALIAGDFSLNEVYFNGRVGIGTNNPNEYLEIANTNLSGSHSGRMIVSDGKGANRRALLFVSPNHNDSDTNARIESYNYGTGKGCNLEINRVGRGKAELFGNTVINGILKVSSSTTAESNPQAGMIRWNAAEQSFEGYNGSDWLSLSNINEGWGLVPEFQEDSMYSSNDYEYGDRFGSSVSISPNYIIVGAPYKRVNGNSQQGQVYIFREETNVLWGLNDPNGSTYEHFGSSVSVYENNTLGSEYCYVVIGAEGANSNKGKVFVYKREYDNGTIWAEKAVLTAPDAANYDYFGCSVSISNNYLVVGAYGKNNYQGKAYIYASSDNGETWNYVTSITASDGTQNDKFGKSVSIYYHDYNSSYDVIAGAYNKQINGNNSQGKVYIFHGNANSVQQVAGLVSSDGAAGDNFGISVSIAYGYAVVGADHKTISNATQQGEVYFLKYDNSTWYEFQKVIASDGSDNDRFGHSVCIDMFGANSAIIGASNKPWGSEEHLGKAYIYSLLGNEWKEEAKIIPSDKGLEYCGTSVFICRTTAAIGCYDRKILYVEKKY